MKNIDKYPFSPGTSQANELRELFQSGVKNKIEKALKFLDEAGVIDTAMKENFIKTIDKKGHNLNNKGGIPYNIKQGECGSDSDGNSYFINDRGEPVSCR